MRAMYTLCPERLCVTEPMRLGLLPLGGGFARCRGLGGPPAARSSSATMAKIQSSLDYPHPAGCLFLVDKRGRLHPADLFPRASEASVIIVYHPSALGLAACTCSWLHSGLFVQASMLTDGLELVQVSGARAVLAVGLHSSRSKS